MRVRNCSNSYMTKVLPSYLTGQGRRWFSKLAPLSVQSYMDLCVKLKTRFFQSKTVRRNINNLATIDQKNGETLNQFYYRFAKELLLINDADERLIFSAFINGLDPNGAWAELRAKLTRRSFETSQAL